MPKVAALTNRRFRAAGFIGQEPRVGMRSNVADWTSIARLDDHPMIFVARGTHGLYFSDQDEALIISGADDPSVRNCGRNEGVAAFESDQGNRMRSC
jgi:hypothetical protein